MNITPALGEAGSHSRATRRRVLQATAGALAVGAISGQGGAQQATGPTVYVGSDYGPLYAVDAATGTKEWTFTISEPYSNVESSPTVVDGTVYVGFSGLGEDRQGPSEDDLGTLYAVDATTGTKEWAFSEPDSMVNSSPTVVDGTVYVGSSDATLYAVDATTGDQQWTFTDPEYRVESSPTVVDGTVYVGSGEGSLWAVDAATGDRQWVFTEPDDTVRSSPTVADGTVYVGSYDNNLYAVDARTGDQQWAFPTGGRVQSSPVVVDGTVYLGPVDDTVYAVDAATGTEEWTFTRLDGGLSSPTVAEGTVYVGAGSSDPDDGALYALDATTGDKQWVFTEPDELVYSVPTVANGTVYVGSNDSTLYAVDTATGDQQWVFSEPSFRLLSSPTVVDDPESGNSVGSRVMLQTLGHHEKRDDRVRGPSPAAITVRFEEAADIQAGEQLGVTFSVENTGGITVTRRVKLRINGRPMYSTEVSVEGGASTTETFSLPTHNSGIGEHTLTVETTDDEATETVRVSEPPSSDGSGPGFGVGGALAGVGGAGYLLQRRLSAEEIADKRE